MHKMEVHCIVVSGFHEAILLDFEARSVRLISCWKMKNVDISKLRINYCIR